MSKSDRGPSCWLRIQQQPSMDYVGYMDIDLTLVDRVKVTCQNTIDEPVQAVEIIYGGTLKPMLLKGVEAAEFAVRWKTFLTSRASFLGETKRPPVGHILLPSDMKG